MPGMLSSELQQLQTKQLFMESGLNIQLGLLSQQAKLADSMNGFQMLAWALQLTGRYHCV